MLIIPKGTEEWWGALAFVIIEASYLRNNSGMLNTLKRGNCLPVGAN